MTAVRLAFLRNSRGFSLIEIMVVVAIVSILASVAFPAYNDHVRRGRAADALGGLSSWATRMEQYYLDNKRYDQFGANPPSPCSTLPVVNGYTMTCAVTGGGQAFTLTATENNNQGTYTLSEGNQKQTTMFKGSSTSKVCWLLKGSEC